VIDINDGLEVKKQMKEMSDIFKEFKDKYKAASSDTVYQCSLLLTLFYDGILLYDRNTDSLWPLLCSIVNCNPSHRSKLGVGLSLTALHNIKPGSGAEKYFVKNILTEELKQLERGILFSFDHPVTSQRVKVFLQARCVFTHLDTVALQHFGRIQGSGSRAGCTLCKSVLGQSNLCLGKVVYNGERGKLEQGHWLRDFGQNLGVEDIFMDLRDVDGNLVKDVPADFYGNGDASQAHIFSLFSDAKLENGSLSKAGKKKLSGQSTSKNVVGKTTPVVAPVIDVPLMLGLTKDQILQAANPLTPPQPWNWYNNMFPLSLFKDALYYPLRDTRPQQFYEHVSTETYIRDGTIAEAREQAYIDSFNGAQVPKTKKNTFAENGCNGVNPLVRELKGFGFEKMGFDLMHFCSNAGSYFLEFFKGSRGLSDIQRRCCVAQKIFPFMKFKGIHPPWRLMEKDIITVDSLVNSLIVPSGFSNHFNMKFPAKRTGHLRAKEHTIFMTVYAHYVYSFTRMKAPYKSFVARFASDLNRLSNPCISWSELRSLIKSVYETGGLREGMFPDSEKNFVLHEIVDIVNHIAPLGHVRGVECYNGERSLSTIGRLRAKGGLHYVKGIFYNYVALENTFKFDTSVKFNFLDNSQPVQKYSDFVLKLYGKSEKNFVLNTFEINRFYESLLNVLNSEIDGSIVYKSNFFRLHSVYKICKDMKLKCFNDKHLTFHDWLKALFKRFKVLESEGFDHITHLVTDQYSDLICGVMYLYDQVAQTPGRVEEFTSHGFVFLSDFTGIIEDLVSFTPTIFKKAIIKGLAFTARGKVCREGMEAPVYKNVTQDILHHYPTNPLNYLHNNWWKSQDYSSWCAVKHYNLKDVTETTSTKTEMGQANYFFRVNWKSDALVCGLAFADMTMRHSIYDAKRRHFYVSPHGNSFNNARQFVCLNYVCSTKLALSVLDKDNLPIIKQRKFGSARWTADPSSIRVASPGSLVSRIYFLEMHPERIDYLYRSFEEDLDGTRNVDVNSDCL
jgi:hypothetical protein